VSCSPHEKESRIKKGKTVDDKSYPYVAKIEKSGKQVCTGVLIDKNWVLTLKKCIDER
jgi:V8-like Glu-specific endopeptidase